MRSKHLKRISSNVLLLGVVSFLNDFSSEMVIPILPMFIASLGGAGLAVGLIGGLRDSLSSILRVLSGYWSDRLGRRKIFVSSGYLTSALFKLLLAFSKVWQHILVFASLERVGKGLRTAPRDAIIADSMPREKGRGFGIHRALDTLGAIVGSATVFILFWFLGFHFKSIILAAATLAFLSLIPLHFVREKSRKPRSVGLRISLRSLPGALRAFILVSSTFSLANFSYMFFILRAQESFAGRWSVGMPILLYILFNAFYAALAVPFGRLSDRVGREKVIVSGYLLFSATSLGFALLDSPFSLVFLFAMYGTVYAMVDGNQRAYVSDLSPAGLRATALGTFHTATGLAALPASSIAGLLWEIDPRATFAYGAAVSALAVALFGALGQHFRARGTGRFSGFSAGINSPREPLAR